MPLAGLVYFPFVNNCQSVSQSVPRITDNSIGNSISSNVTCIRTNKHTNRRGRFIFETDMGGKKKAQSGSTHKNPPDRNN